jgi:hypothetical protein
MIIPTKAGISTMPDLLGQGNFSPAITLEVTPEMMKTLELMSRDSGQPLNVVFTRAIALYRAALLATTEGKHVGYAASTDALEVEFTGLTGIEGR